ncbi:hypothetical protein [Gluconobacter sp.]|uniref:hypothetical protein n=1 Tax=Gluconobacter sp. TaxID=1876758 RepID=UPI0039EC611E
MLETYLDYSAPIVRNGEEGRELVLVRWGMPLSAFVLKERKVGVDFRFFFGEVQAVCRCSASTLSDLASEQQHVRTVWTPISK